MRRSRQYNPAHRAEALGGHLVAAKAELGDELLGEDALTRGEDLAQLYVGRAESFEGAPQAPREPGARHGGASATVERIPARERSAEEGTDAKDAYAGRCHASACEHRGLGACGGAQLVDAGSPGEGRRFDEPRRVVGEGPDREVRWVMLWPRGLRFAMIGLCCHGCRP